MAERLTLFPEEETKRMLGELAIPVHTTEALDNYFFRGWQPGGFLISILTNDLYGAVRSADYANKHVIYEIVQWLTLEPIVPIASACANFPHQAHHLGGACPTGRCGGCDRSTSG